jgi:hypothetical protein
MVVALIALVLAGAGSAVAAVTYATNAGAVDGKSAVSAGVSTATAAGKLVATTRKGAARGKVPAQYLALPDLVAGKGQVQAFERAIDVVDNAQGAPQDIAGIFGFGVLRAACNDQNVKAGVEDPQSTISFTNGSGTTINVARIVGNGAADVRPVPPGTVYTFNVDGSNLFQLNVQRGAVSLLVNGVIRQDGRNTATAQCLQYGQTLRVGA